MRRFYKRGKQIGLDIAGIILILLGISFGWLPGPGGIPLVLAGLGLLSVNHHWAKRIITEFEQNSKILIQLIFKDSTFYRVAHDMSAVILISIGILGIFYSNNDVIRAICIVLIFAGTSEFFINRERFTKVVQKLKKLANR